MDAFQWGCLAFSVSILAGCALVIIALIGAGTKIEIYTETENNNGYQSPDGMADKWYEGIH